MADRTPRNKPHKKNNKELICGRNAAYETIRANRRHIHKLIVAETTAQSASGQKILMLARESNIPVQFLPRRKLDDIAGGEHQGVVLETGRYPMVDLAQILAQAKKLNEPPFIIIADHIEDPHNLGAMLRTAEIVGVHGLILPNRRSVEVTPAVVKASAGATEHILIAQVSNLVQTIKKLKQANIWVVGVENSPEALIYNQANLTSATAMVIGSEGKGISRLVKEHCDFLVKLPMRGKIESLNASVACGIILYEIWRAREFAPK